MKKLRSYIEPLTHIGMIVTAIELKTVLYLALNIACNIKAVGINTVLVQSKTIPVNLVRIIKRTTFTDRYIQCPASVCNLTFTAIGIDSEAICPAVFKINIDKFSAIR